MTAAPPLRPAGRQHYWDTLRAALMLFGIPYHSALAFQAGGWIVVTRHTSPVLDYVAEAIHLFRMPAFFVVAGYFAALSLTKYPPGRWFRARLARLGIPLVASLLTIIPVLDLGCYLGDHDLAGALVLFGENAVTSGGFWVRHLWFIIVLLYMCGAAALLAVVNPALRGGDVPARLDRWCAAHPLMVLLALGTVIGLFEAVTIELFYIGHWNRPLPQDILRIDDLLGAIPWFVAGFTLQRAPATLAALGRGRVAVGILAMVAIATTLMLFHHSWAPVYRFVGSFAAILTTQTILAAARRWFDRPSPVIDRLVRGSFVIYLFHLPVIVWLALVVDRLGTPPGVDFVLVASLTLAITLAIAALVERSPLLSLLYSGTRAAAQPRPPHAPAAVAAE